MRAAELLIVQVMLKREDNRTKALRETMRENSPGAMSRSAPVSNRSVVSWWTMPSAA